MAIAVGSTSNTPTYGTRTNSVITAPTSIANGDLLVAVLHAGNSSGTAVTVTPPAGFTEVTNSPIAESYSGYTIASHVYYKVASGESGNYTFSHSSADTEGYMYRLTGADTSTPIDVTPATAVANLVNNGTTTELATITTVTNGAFIIAQDSAWDAPGAGNWSGTTPTLTTRRTGSISKLADGTLATAGATGARTRTNGNTGGGNLPWVSIIVAIRPATGGGGINGTASITEGADTVSSAGALAIKGSSAITEAADTVSATGKLALSGTAAITEGADTLSSTGKLAIVGSSSITEDADTVAATGTLIAAGTGTASITEGADTLSATGALAIKATASIAEGADTVTATGKVAITGSASITEGADTLNATGTGASLSPITGTASITEDPDILVATGAKIIPLVDTGGSGNQAGRAKRRRNINDDPDAFAELLEEWREKKRKKQAKDEEKQEVSQSEPDTIGPELYRQLLALEQAYERSMEAAEKLISKRNVRAAMTAAKELEDAQAAYQSFLDEEDEEIIALFAA